MSVGLITITHNRIGEEILGAACQIIGHLPLCSEHFAVPPEIEPGELRARLRATINGLDEGDGVLILTDLYGASPCNMALAALPAANIRVVTGLNLPMVLRACNYAHLDLETIATRAAAGGQRGVMEAHPQRTEC